MKTAIAVTILALLSVVGASAQAHSSVPDQKMCYDQATKYVRDQNEGIATSDFYSFLGAHFNSTTRVCYVRYGHFDKTMGMTSDFISDAFEGTTLVSYNAGVCYLAHGSCQAEDLNHFKLVLAKYFPWVFAK